MRGNTTFPFTGKMSSDGSVETVKGTFKAGDQTYDFTSTQGEDDDFVTFTTGSKKYRLAMKGGTDMDDEGLDVDRLIAQQNPVRTPDRAPVMPDREPVMTDRAPMVADRAPVASDRAPVTSDRAPVVFDRAPQPMTNRTGAQGANVPGDVKLRKVEILDINMGNVPAYTMLVPDGWKVEGHIEWSNDKTPYPQKKFSVTGPDNSRINFLPAMSFAYSEITDVARQESAAMGMPQVIPDRQGVAPPRDLGAWIVSALQQGNKQIRNVRLVEDKRDTVTEQAVAEMSRQAGVAVTGEQTIHIVTITYDKDGVPFTERLNLSYGKLPPSYTRNINMWSWMLFTNSIVSAPTAKFEQMTPLLYTSVNSLRTVPQWYTQQQELIMQISRNNHQIDMAAIRKRGETYSQISDTQHAAWKKTVASSDNQQNDRINSIYEVSDFKDTDGLGVKLPIHYDNYYSDGKGSYLMTNNASNPGSDWSKLEPSK